MAVSPDFEDRVQSVLAVPGPEPNFADGLRLRLLAQAAGQPVRKARPTLRPAWAIALIVLLLLGGTLLAIGPERAWAAVQRLLGYIPGIGFVDDSTRLLALEAPVVQTRDGITLTVSQAIADSSRTVVIYEVEGLSIDAANSQGEGAANLGSLGQLVLPNGTSFEQNGGDGAGWGSGYRMRLIFPALAPGVDAVTFRLPRLNGMPPGAAPENWELPLRFKPAPPSLTIAPVLEMTQPPATEGPTPSAGAAPYGISLSVDKVVTLEEGYLLVGSTAWDNSAGFAQGLMPTGWITITDASGQLLPAQEENPDAIGAAPPNPGPVEGTPQTSPVQRFETDTPPASAAQRFQWAYRLQGKTFNGPLTLTLDTVDAWFPAEGSFTFDVGTNPQVGQTWTLGKKLDLAGHRVTVVSAQMITDRSGTGYEFTFRSDPDVSSVALTVPSAPPAGGGGGGAMGEFKASMIWSGMPPVGELTFKTEGVDLILHGPWRVQWQPPVAASSQATATPPASVCLTFETGRSAGSYRNSSLTPDLKGRLLLYGPMDGHAGYVISTVRLDGSDRVYVGQGTWPSFSPDGSKVAYSGSDGLYVHDLAAGTDLRLSGTNENDYHPLWSPLGDRIAFVRGVGAFDLFVIGADGSGLKRITMSPEYEELTGWLPDGKRVVYSVVVGGVTTIRSVEVESGDPRELFQLAGRVKSVGAAPSPDGQSIVFTDVLFGNPSGGLYLARLDGSERRLIAALGMGGLSAPVWSPDGKWLAARLPDTIDPVPVPVLFQPGTCTVIVLDQLRGEVEGWGP